MNLVSLLKLREKYGYHLGINEIPYAINNKGEVVGNFEVHKDGPYIPLSFPFLWSSQGAVHLGSGLAMDINDHSQVILSVMTNPSMCFLWENGDRRLMWNGGKALAINNYGVVVGFSEKGGIIWDNGNTSYLLDLLENPEGWERIDGAEDINDRGEIVGSGIYRGQRTAFILTPCE